MAKVKLTYQFATEDSIASAIIRWYTWSPFSHVDLVLPDGSLLGARLKGGVQIRQPGYAKFTKTARYCVEVEEDQANMLYNIARLQVGKPYNTRAILAFAFEDYPDAGGASWDCSELQIWLLFKIGIKALNLNPEHVNRITPRDLLMSPCMEPA